MPAHSISSALEKQIHSSITNGITFLYNDQQPDGSFLSLSSPRKTNFSKALIFHSTFSTSLILTCLHSIPETTSLQSLKKKAVSFLLSQKSEVWSFNYWARDSQEAKTLMYPDDLDDTACALAALTITDSSILDGHAMSGVATVLTNLEIEEGGPYRTWLVNDQAAVIWQDVDLAVNSNIAYFLSLHDVVLPNITRYIDREITTEKIASPYYPSVYPLLYFISRAYHGEYRDQLISLLYKEQHANGSWGTPLATALALSSLLNLGESGDNFVAALKFLVKMQKNNSWPAEPFYTGVNPNRDSPFYAGSATLTTALCLEALNQSLYMYKHTSTPTDPSDQVYSAVLQQIQTRVSTSKSSLHNELEIILKSTLEEKNIRQIALLPYHFSLALGKNNRKIPESLIITLGVATLYGWLAYTLYDNFLDDEPSPRTLPTANLALRELTTIFSSLFPGTDFSTFFQDTIDTLENANTWEVTHCRIPIKNSTLQLRNFVLPDYGDLSKLAERSLGHLLSPVAILYQLGCTQNDPECQSIISFFNHYLIARQLHDDAHDWEEDLKMGHVNTVVALLLKKHNSKKNVPIEILLPQLQKLFWYKIIPIVTKTIMTHVTLAKKSLIKSEIIKNPAVLEQMLMSYETGAREVLIEREKALEFLKNYT